jgi:hypothetical protein
MSVHEHRKWEKKMSTLHKAISEIRALESDEIDLVNGGDISAEVAATISYSTIQVSTPVGSITVSVPDDASPDVSFDWS